MITVFLWNTCSCTVFLKIMLVKDTYGDPKNESVGAVSCRSTDSCIQLCKMNTDSCVAIKWKILSHKCLVISFNEIQEKDVQFSPAQNVRKWGEFKKCCCIYQRLVSCLGWSVRSAIKTDENHLFYKVQRRWMGGRCTEYHTGRDQRAW